MNTRTVIVVSVFVILTTAYLQAAVIPGRWEKVEALEEGYPIVVTMEGWDRIKGAFRGVEEESLLLVKDDGKDLNLPMADVRRVESQDDIPSDEIVGVIALSAGIGAGIGFVGDAAIKTADVFYEAPKD